MEADGIEPSGVGFKDPARDLPPPEETWLKVFHPVSFLVNTFKHHSPSRLGLS
jgi:hypothetical protein